MIFQEPMTSLNPVLPVGEQVAESLRIHFSARLAEAEIQERSIDLLRQVQIAAPEQRVHDYPHQLSGGLRQRVMMAMAMSCRPRLLIADEPTTALDVTIQAQILELIKELQNHYGLSLLLITHNLGLIGELCRSGRRNVCRKNCGAFQPGRPVPASGASLYPGAFGLDPQAWDAGQSPLADYFRPGAGIDQAAQGVFFSRTLPLGL